MLGVAKARTRGSTERRDEAGQLGHPSWLQVINVLNKLTLLRALLQDIRYESLKYANYQYLVNMPDLKEYDTFVKID
ncbi:hypothetical protein HanIR_Chr09g0411721 [Helianthus annuus]|nr:hypothetical protein HanIR_Chr09g0411721 [Helianthus annuus]